MTEWEIHLSNWQKSIYYTFYPTFSIYCCSSFFVVVDGWWFNDDESLKRSGSHHGPWRGPLRAWWGPFPIMWQHQFTQHTWIEVNIWASKQDLSWTRRIMSHDPPPWSQSGSTLVSRRLLSTLHVSSYITGTRTTSRHIADLWVKLMV